MEKLIKFILKEITGSNDFSVEEKEDERGFILEIKAGKDLMGIIIGKGGKTIKSIQDLVRVKGRLEGKNVFVNVSEA